MTLLVTGGAGFIGSNFVLDWLAAPDSAGEPIVNLDALTYAGNRENLAALDGHARHVFVHGDTTDRALLDRLLAEHRPRAIVHFAAESHVDRSIHGPGAFIHTNVQGTFTLLEAARAHWGTLQGTAREAFRFHHVSTDEVYGTLQPGDAPWNEDCPYSPNSPYAASKAASDHLVRSFQHTYHLPTLTTNCSNNYGPYLFPEKVIPLMILNALEGKPLPVYGDGQQIRDWLYVEDHTAAIWLVLTQGRIGETYNIGGLNERRNLDLVNIICALLDRQSPRADGRSYAGQIAFVADRPGHDRRYAIDSAKIRRELGWQPRENFDTGIAKTVDWYLRNRAWAADITATRYARERLGAKG